MDINCDMGEGLDNEESLMPFISSANIACGYHAGNPDTMQQVIFLCLAYGVKIGAHPSFADRENFGRTAMQLPGAMIYDLVRAQLAILNNIAMECGTKLYHVKPHGALYNQAAIDVNIARAISAAVYDFNPELLYFGLSGSVMIEEAAKTGLQTANEVFADRSYQNDGSLTPRTEPNALIKDVQAVKQRVKKFATEQQVITTTGGLISLQADTICIHGDGAYALEFAKATYEALHEK